MKIKLTKRFREKANWFNSFSYEVNPLSNFDLLIEDKITGVSALDCFYCIETYGKYLNCKDTETLRKLLNGKWKHGITVEACAKSFVERLLTSKEIKTTYPKWVANEIFKQAEKIALNEIGFVPTFIREQKDYSEY